MHVPNLLESLENNRDNFNEDFVVSEEEKSVREWSSNAIVKTTMGCKPSKSTEAAVISGAPRQIDAKKKASEQAAVTVNPLKKAGGATPQANGGVAAVASATITAATATDGTKVVHSRKDWAVRPGYSSGASSFGSETDTEGNETENNLRKSSRSRHSDILALQSLRQEIVEEGDLAQAVVRIETPFGKPIEEIYEGVHDGPVLGSGVSGIVRLVTHRATGLKYAVKVLDMGLIDTTEGLMALRNEIFILSQLDHPNVVRIEEVYESTTDVYIVQELCLGGDLFDRLDEQTDYHYTEAQCARLIKQMLSSIRYLHSKGIIHRDLKLENFLFSNTTPDSDLKMIDFGLSKHFELGESHTEKVGTPYTVAPEIIRGEYDEKCDLWALGVITFLLLSGETPFGGLDGESLIAVKQSILKAHLRFVPEDIWDSISDAAKDFVKALLNPDPKKRPSAKDAQKMPWIQIWAKKDVKEGTRLNKKTVGALIAFKECSDMQKLLSEVLSFTLLPEQIVELKTEFEKIDTEGVGEISLSDLKKILMENAEEGSLGALTEQEIEDIFDAIRIRKTEPTIRWHEFLAAGLSQARVDDRNLRLAFERLDNERKGFITFDDMQDLLGSSTEYDALERIWTDCLLDCKAHLDRITFDDFKRLMKGQPKDRCSLSGSAAFSSGKNFMTSETSIRETSILQIVPEGKHPDEEPIPDDNFASDVKNVRYGKMRSRSFEQKGTPWEYSTSSLGEYEQRPTFMEKDASRAVMLVGRDDDDEVHRDSSMSPLVVNRAIYRMHREMRLAVLEASKQFDKKRTDWENTDQASLIMRRGAKPPVELEDAHQRAILQAAAQRCGRSKRARNKTVSDVTGMLAKSSA